MRKAAQKTKPDNPRAPHKLGVLLRVLIALAVVLCVPVVNYTIDPSRLYHTSRADSLELQAVEFLLDGQNAANLSNCNERLLKREYLRRTDRTLDTVVLGSSRGAMITAGMLGADNFFNLSVSGATLDDLVGIYGYLLLSGQQPERVVISIDPWVLNDNFSDTRSWEAFGDGITYVYEELLGVPVAREYIPEGLYDPENENRQNLLTMSGELKLNLFSIPYFQSALQNLANGNYATYSRTEQTDLNEGETGILRADGSYSYPAEYRNADETAIIQRAETSLPGSVLGMEDYESLDTQNRELFETFIKTLTENGVQVDFLLEPVSPVIYDHMKSESRYACYFQAEQMFRDMAQPLGIRVAGSFDPYALGMTAYDFYDGYHLKPDRIEELVAMLEQMPVEESRQAD